jgi:phosphonate transport system substrate-binding protein
MTITSPNRRRLCAAIAISLPMPARAAPGRRVIRFGLTPVFLDDRLGVLQLWRQYLNETLRIPVEFVQRSSYTQVVDSLRFGDVDFAWICGYPYVLHQRALALVAVPRWRGRPLYQSYLIADSRGSVRSLGELRGRRFAYSDPLSNSGFLYIQHLLRRTGNDPTRYFGRTLFTYSHRYVVEAVADGLVDAGAVDGYVWETLTELKPQLGARTRVVERSPDFGFPPIVAGAGTAAADISAFGAALLGMPRHPLGRKVLAELRLDGFDEATPALFDEIAAMARGQGT